ncbi:MAG TPA: rod shape-determining protein MreC [Burkholderiaceae bacterium]|nr:rod shape-determining protein MreC [Burkholderiaceae bacterium]
MEYGPPALFNQGVSARARLAFFSLLAVALIIVDSRAGLLETVRTGLGVVLYPVQQVLLVPRDVAGRIGEFFTSVSSLTRENDQLKRAVVEQARELSSMEALAAENAQLRKLLGARERAGGSGMLVQVLYETRDRFSRKLVIDRGSNDGLAGGSPVIDDLGVIGQVTRVFPWSAEVTLVTDKDQATPVQVLRNGLRGIAFGGVDPGTMELRFMPANADVVNEDLLVTSGLDGVYPPGLPVAKVTRVERAAKDQFSRVVLAPVAGVHRHVYVLVLKFERTASPVAPAATPRKRDDTRARGERK